MRPARRAKALLALAFLLPLAGCAPGADVPDLDDDGWVGRSDVELALACVGLEPATTLGCAVADTNRDGRVDGSDVFSLSADYGKRLVVLSDDGSAPAPAWHVYVWSVAWETHFTNLYSSDFRCTPNRGHTTNELFILNLS